MLLQMQIFIFTWFACEFGYREDYSLMAMAIFGIVATGALAVVHETAVAKLREKAGT